MKHKLLTFALMGALASTLLFSCTNAEEPIPSPGDNNSGETVEYSISVNIPEEMRTREASVGSIGDSGLFEFPLRTIDKLWYAMYYDGVLKSSSTVIREDEEPFSFTIRLSENNVDPTKIWFFFWAGNQADQINTGSSNKYNDIVTINYTNFTVTLSRYGLPYSQTNFYDSFTGYFQFTDSKDQSLRTTSFTLKRPFAQFHLLSDDFIVTDLYKDYPNGIKTYFGFGDKKVENNKEWEALTLLPNVWHYDINEVSSSSFEKNDLEFNFLSNSDLTWFKNTLEEDNNPNRTIFKNRKMDYLACFYCFAPFETQPLCNKKNSSTILNRLNFSIQNAIVSNTPSIDNSSKFVSVNLPSEGLKANNIYVIYDKARSDDGTGFLDGYFDYEILVNHDGTWESPNHENEVDKL